MLLRWVALMQPLLLLMLLAESACCAAASWRAVEQQLPQAEDATIGDDGSSDSISDVAEDLAVRTPSIALDAAAAGSGGTADGSHRLLVELSELLRQELDRRAAATAKTTAGPSVGSTTASSTILFEAVTTANSTINGTAAGGPANFFVALWLKLRKLLPLPALIAALTGGGLLLLLIFILIIYCCCCREKSRLSRQAPAQSILYKDLDLSGANRPPYGIINYSLEYDLKKDNLLVTVSNCQDLPKGLDSLDPYVTVSVMSKKEEKKGLTRGSKPKTSKTVRNTSNPVFNFACVFPVKRKSELKEKIIVFEVFDWDYGIKHDMVARKVLHLGKMGEGLDDILGRNVDFTKPLRKGLPRDERGPGDICLSLYYAAKDMSLTVNIVECKGVFVTRGKEEPDLETLPNTFVKLSLRNPQIKKEHVKRSKTVLANRNPYFNQQFIFDVGSQEMLERCILRITLVHRTDTLKIKRPVGSLELHSGAEDDSLPLLHWKELLGTPNRATARWHNLVTPEAEERNRKVREKEEKRKLEEAQEEAEAEAAARG